MIVEKRTTDTSCTPAVFIISKLAASEIPEGTKRNPMMLIRKVPRDSTHSILMILNVNREYRIIKPITGVGTGIDAGNRLEIMFETKRIAEYMPICNKTEAPFFFEFIINHPPLIIFKVRIT